MNRKTAAFAVFLAVLNASVILAKGQGDGGFVPNNLYVTSSATKSIVGVDPVSGTVEPALITGLPDPQALLFGPDGLLYMTDAVADRIFVFDASGTQVSEFGVGSGLDGPTGMELGPSGGLYVASFFSASVFRFDRLGNVVQEIQGGGGNGPVISGPEDVVFGPDGHLFVSSLGSNLVCEYDPSGVFVDTIGGDAPSLSSPWGMTFGRKGRLFVASFDTDRVVVFAADGSFVEDFGVGAGLSGPTDVVLGPDANLWVASFHNSKLLVFHGVDGTLLRTIDLSASAGEPQGLAFAPFSIGAALKATLQRPGSAARRVKETGHLTLLPGTGRVTWLSDDPESDMSQTFGEALVFHGFGVGNEGHQRYHLEQIDASAHATGVGSLMLDVSGKVLEHEVFDFRKGKGELHLSGPGGILRGTLKTKK